MTAGPEPERKLSEIIQEMAFRLVKDPEAFPGFPVAHEALKLASAAWNCAIDETEWSGPTPSAELRSNDTRRLVAELIEHKRTLYPNDRRRIAATELTPDGQVRVQWFEPENDAGPTRGGPIASKLIRRMRKKTGGKLVTLGDARAAEASQTRFRKQSRARPPSPPFIPRMPPTFSPRTSSR